MKSFLGILLLVASGFAGASTPEYGPITKITGYQPTRVHCEQVKARGRMLNQIRSEGLVDAGKNIIRIYMSDEAVNSAREIREMCQDLQRGQKYSRTLTLLGQWMSDMQGGAIFSTVQTTREN